ncbi:MAG: hypothetical protein H6577_10165 [Lewinellaceae bacterium]|nr:hypothetical protein [Saprospiraceae bacterium]MCB9338481.1 hypothetical protein [Lewinellaceae bacterium]
MRKIIAIHLLTLFLFSALVPVQVQEELAKLPTLLKHFDEHKIQTPDLSLFAFLEMHYGEEFAQHRSAHDHSKLPGKGACNHLHAPAPAVLPVAILTTASTPVAVAKQPVLSDQSYTFILPHDIWQPPRA